MKEFIWVPNDKFKPQNRTSKSTRQEILGKIDTGAQEHPAAF
jgi:hypothetical protein